MLLSFAAGDVQQLSNVSALTQGLQELGWTQGRNIELNFRFGAGDPSRMQAYAAELVDGGSDVLVGNGTAVLTALQQRTRTIPIVFVHVSDPVGSGLVPNLARPGGNITGFMNFEFSMGSKWLELLREIAPQVRRVALIFNPNTAPAGGAHFVRSIEAAAPSLKVAVVAEPQHAAAGIDAASASIARSLTVASWSCRKPSRQRIEN